MSKTMTAKELWDTVNELKMQTIMNGHVKPKEVDDFFNDHWMSILDILDDALYKHLNK